jgi:hypothetical protein
VKYKPTKQDMNPATVVPVAGPVAEATEVRNANKLALEDITCCFTLKSCVYLTGDAVMCLPCCCFCGGCCGRYSPCVFNAFPDESIKPGPERFQATCYVQTFAAMLMPWTLCGCLWGCCGTCTPCAKGLAQCIMGVEARDNAKAEGVVVPPPVQNGMER